MATISRTFWWVLVTLGNHGVSGWQSFGETYTRPYTQKYQGSVWNSRGRRGETTAACLKEDERCWTG